MGASRGQKHKHSAQRPTPSAHLHGDACGHLSPQWRFTRKSRAPGTPAANDVAGVSAAEEVPEDCGSGPRLSGPSRWGRLALLAALSFRAAGLPSPGSDKGLAPPRGSCRLAALFRGVRRGDRVFAPCRGIASTVPVVGAVTEYPLPRCLGGALSPGQSASRAPVATAGSIGVSGTDATAIVARRVARRVPRAASRPLLAPGPGRQGGSWARLLVQPLSRPLSVVSQEGQFFSAAVPRERQRGPPVSGPRGTGSFRLCV